MGEFADMAVDAALDHYWEFGDEDDCEEGFLIPTRSKKNYQSGTGHFNWKIADGSVIAMRDMSNTHIMNALKLCDEMGNTAKAAEFKQVLQERSEQNERPEATEYYRPDRGENSYYPPRLFD